MAKVVGMIGSASGKVGNVVYAVTNGIQTARVYQPVVSNPKSAAQMLQRSKANLAGRLSAITPREAIVGLGNSARTRRAAFLRNILLEATSSISDGDYVAKIEPVKLVFSKGSSIPVIVVTSVTVSSVGVVTVNYKRPNFVQQSEWDVSGGMFVVVAIDNVSGKYDFVRTFQWAKPAYPGAETALSQEVSVEDIDAHSLFVFFVPFVLNNQSGSTVSSDVAVNVSDIIANLGLTEAASNLAFGNSKFVGLASQQ